MGNSHSSNNKKESNNNLSDYNNNDNNRSDPDGGELPAEYFYEYRERDRNNLNRTILLEISSESFGNIRHQVPASTTLQKVKEIINDEIQLNFENFILEINKTTNYDKNKIVNDYLYKGYDVVLITIHDTSPKFEIKFDTSDIKNDFPNLQKSVLKLRQYDRIKEAYKKVTKLLNISPFRYTLKFNDTVIPFSEEKQLENHMIDINFIDDNNTIKIENLSMPPSPDEGFHITVRFYGEKRKINASRKNIVDDVTFIDIFNDVDKERLYYVLKGKGTLRRDKTLGEQGVANESTIDAIIKLNNRFNEHK